MRPVQLTILLAVLAAGPPAAAADEPAAERPTAYARTGLLEAGGAAGLAVSQDFTSATLTPSIGWFIRDHVELSALLGVSHLATEDDSATMVSVLAEPSYHLPFGSRAFGFIGLGVGGAHLAGPGLAAAVAPRVGANFLLGRSGVLTPSLSYLYTMHEDTMTSAGRLITVGSAMAASLGYTIMW